MVPQPQPLAYVFPSPLLLTSTARPLPNEGRRPLPISIWKAHPCTFRTAVSIRYSVTCSANNQNEPNDLNKLESSWGPFKPWFDKNANNKTSSSSIKQDEEEVIPETVEDGNDTPSSVTGDAAASSEAASTNDPFQWPWKRGKETGSQNSSMDKQDSEQKGDPSSVPSPSSNQTVKKRAKHSDSKPGPTIDVEEKVPLSEKEDSLQDQLKQIVDKVVSNLPGGKSGSKQGTINNSLGDKKASVKGKSTDKPIVQKRPSKFKGLSGIRELYKPPSESPSGDENTDGEKKVWFKVPWVREPSSDSEDIEEDKIPDVGKSVTGIFSSTSKKGDVAGKDHRDTSKGGGNVKNANEQVWYTPPWKKQGSSEQSTEVSDLNLPSDDSQKSLQERNKFGDHASRNSGGTQNNFEGNASQNKDLPASSVKKSWLRWPGKPNDSDTTTNDDLNVQAVEGEEADENVLSPSKKSAEAASKRELIQDPIEHILDVDDESETQEEGTIDEHAEEGIEILAQKGRDLRPPQSTGRTILTEAISIPQRDIASIRLIFGSETFFATETMTAPGGLIFRGNLRGEPKATLAKLDERLAARFGDKYTLCLAEGEEDRRPVVVVVPSAYHRRSVTPRQRLMAIGVAMMTVSTCLSRGMAANVLRPRIFAGYGVPPVNNLVDKLFFHPMSSSVAVASAIVMVIWASQLAQRLVAKYHRTRVALPFILPSYQLGSFGAVVHISSPTPTRAALFDIALAGVIALVVPSLICLVIGLRLSTSFASVFPVPMSMVSGSVLLGFMTKQVPNGQILVDYGKSLIGLHPLAIIGANCLTIAALNLLPIRQLDGGRIISALYGRKVALVASRVAVLFLLFASSKNPYLIMFLLAVSFGPWHVDRPSKNELTEPDGFRTIVGYLFMLLMISILLPYPKSPFFGTS